jgi:hypothetical protein
MSLPFVLEGMRSAVLRHLTALSISRLRVKTEFPPDIDGPICGLFPSAYPPLKSLRLSDIVFEWADMCSFDCLTELVLHKLLGALAPTSLQLATLLKRLPRLLRLSMRCVECIGPFDDHLRLELPSIVVLDASFDAQAGLGRFLSSCTFPSLLTFSVLFIAPFDVEILSSCRSILAPVKCFIGSGYASGTVDISTIYRAMPAVTSIDISGGSRSLFSPLLNDYPSADGVICPNLLELRLCEVNMREIKRSALCLVI